MLGSRQPDVYGRETLADIEKSCRRHAKTLGLAAECRQSNREGEMVGWIQAVRGGHHGVVVPPGAYSQPSIALMDGHRPRVATGKNVSVRLEPSVWRVRKQ